MIERLKTCLPPRLRIILGRLRRAIRPYPAILTIEGLVPTGCRFEVASDAERSRVAGLGGEPEFLREFLGVVRQDDVVFDIGACVGLYALHAARLGARSVAFEPDPVVRRHLRRNVRLNRLRASVVIVPWAVADRQASASLSSQGLVGRSPTLEPVRGRRQITVATDSIDRAVAAGELPVPQLVKLDIEGAEILALRGMAETLRRRDGPRLLFVELHPAFLPAFGSSVEECLALVYAAGYVCRSQRQRAEQIHCVLARKGGP